MSRLRIPRSAFANAAFRRVGGWLGAVALAFNLAGSLLLPLGAAPAAGTMVVCTAAGMVAMDESGDAPARADGGASCVFCLPLWQGGADLPAGAQVGPAGAFTVALAAPVAADPAVRGHAAGPWTARAPPAA